VRRERETERGREREREERDTLSLRLLQLFVALTGMSGGCQKQGTEEKERTTTTKKTERGNLFPLCFRCSLFYRMSQNQISRF
jgi:hypothetical protein